MEILLTGRLLPATRMAEVGFINYVVPEAEVLPRAMKIARLIAANSPGAVIAIRRAVAASSGVPLPQAMDNELRIGQPVFALPDAVEGPKAFAQKRKPVWQKPGRSKL